MEKTKCGSLRIWIAPFVRGEDLEFNLNESVARKKRVAAMRRIKDTRHAHRSQDLLPGGVDLRCDAQKLTGAGVEGNFRGAKGDVLANAELRLILMFNAGDHLDELTY